MGTAATILVVLLSLLALVALGLLFFLRRPLPKIAGTIQLQGLKKEVEVIRDRWGVPHIYAASEEDLFFAMGYVHAQDRLWQMEFQRRLAAGRLSEVIGEATLEFDRIFRILGLYRAAEADLAVLEPGSRRVLDAYCAGVNAYIDARPGRCRSSSACCVSRQSRGGRPTAYPGSRSWPGTWAATGPAS